MNELSDKTYRAVLGARVLSEANDLKRTPEALARELGYDLETVRAVIAGQADVSSARALVEAMADAYPVALADLWSEPDDTLAGIKVMRAADSKASARVFDRARRHGESGPYYEYRDTVMSRIAPFKPEWIQPLRVVSDSRPDNPEVAYNNGHLLHQMTFFIGEVNFYWRIGDRAYAAEMNTGDSNYVTPFVPHSFASRNPKKLGLILAVTFAGQVRQALDAFSRMGVEAADQLAGDLRDGTRAFVARLDRHLAAESLSREELAERLAAGGVDRTRAQALIGGQGVATAEELQAIAAALTVRTEDLMVSPLAEGEEVVVRFARDGFARPYPNHNRPAYRLRELVRTRHQPGLKGFQVTVLEDGDGDAAPVRSGLHEYIYNYGNAVVRLDWNGGHQTILAPGDSAYVCPMVGHRLSCLPKEGPGELVLVRAPGALNDAVITEYAAFAPEGRERVAGETRRWF